MAQLVAGFVMPHAPGYATDPEAPPLELRQRCMQAYRTVRERALALEVDTVIVIGDDHYTINGPGCIPTCMIGVGEVEGPIEPWLGIPRSRIQNNSVLAQHILRHGLEHGVDWAMAKTLTLDHSTFLPYHYAVRESAHLRTIPVYLNAGVEPLISSRRCFQIGQAIGHAIAAAPSNERVAIYGTGGMSHWVGMARMGQINPEWDRQIITLMQQGDAQALIELSDREVVDAAGNGAWEIKNWLCAMGAMDTLGPHRGDLILYEPVPEWIIGAGYLQLKKAA